MRATGRIDGGKRRGAMTDAEQRAEREYFALLKAGGAIHDYRYEPVSLRLGPKLHYTPDWLVIHADGAVQFVEQMGRPERDTITRIKVAAELFPWFGYAILWQRGKKWELEEL